jgi:hypothetical protein
MDTIPKHPQFFKTFRIKFDETISISKQFEAYNEKWFYCDFNFEVPFFFFKEGDDSCRW